MLALTAAACLVWAGWRLQEASGNGRHPATNGVIGADQIRRTASPPAAGESGRAMRGVVDAQEVDAWTLRFVRGEAVRVHIHAEGSLDCVAQDAAGNLLDADADMTGRCQLAWMPSHTGSYRIMIRNAGAAASAYQLVAQ
jgi:hypothetical protein